MYFFASLRGEDTCHKNSSSKQTPRKVWDQQQQKLKTEAQRTVGWVLKRWRDDYGGLAWLVARYLSIVLVGPAGVWHRQGIEYCRKFSIDNYHQYIDTNPPQQMHKYHSHTYTYIKISWEWWNFVFVKPFFDRQAGRRSPKYDLQLQYYL